MPQSYSATDMTELGDRRPLEKRQSLPREGRAERMGEDSAGNHLGKVTALEEEKGRRVDSRTRALCWARRVGRCGSKRGVKRQQCCGEGMKVEYGGVPYQLSP